MMNDEWTRECSGSCGGEVDGGLVAALRLVWMGIDCSGNSLMGLGRCHFTSAITKRSPLMMVDLWKPKPKGKNRNRNSLREEARRQAGRQGRGKARKELR
jgi:hypothetical protein